MLHHKPHPEEVPPHPIGKLHIKVLLSKQLRNKHQDLRDLSGAYQDKLIHQREAISTLSIKSHWEPTDMFQEPNSMKNIKS